MTRSKFSFFFTHLAQFYNAQEGVTPWVDVLRPSENSLLPESGTQNNAYFLVSAYQPKGEITFSVPGGQALLDVSSTLNVNVDTLRVDSTVQPVNNFLAQLASPLNPASHYRSLSYAWSNTTQETQYPLRIPGTLSATGSWPNQQVETVTFVQNPWMVQPVAYQYNVPNGQALTYQGLTVDSTAIRVNDLMVAGDVSQTSQLTVDKTLVYLYASQENLVADISPDLSSDSRVLLESVPAGLALIDWKVGDEVVSSTWLPPYGRGYLPASQLDLAMPGAELKEIALSLIALIHQGEEQLVVSALQELCYVWATVGQRVLSDGSLNPDALPGLPTYLPRMVRSQRELANDRSTLQQAWLGYAITYVVKKLRDRPKSAIREIPSQLPLLLRDVAQVVASAVDAVTGQTYTGFDNYGYLKDETDYAAQVMAYLFLHEYLSSDYDSVLHQRAALASLVLSQPFNLQDDLTPDTTSTVQQVALYRLFYNVCTNTHIETDSLVRLLALDALTLPTAFDFGLWLFVLTTLQRQGHTYTFIDLIAHSTLRFPRADGLARYENGIFPDLVATSWTLILETDPPVLLPDLRFNLYAAEARTFVSYLFLEARRMWPFGYRWSKAEAESPSYVLGALLYSQASIAFSWYLGYALMRDGSNLLTAQGPAVDAWAASLNTARPVLQSDYLMRQSLFFNLNRAQSTLSGIQTLADTYGLPLETREPQVLSYLLDGVWVDWTDDPIHPYHLEGTVIKTYPRQYPTPSNPTITTYWSEVAPSLEVITDGHSDQFALDLVSIMPAGVRLLLSQRQLSESLLPTFAQNL